MNDPEIREILLPHLTGGCVVDELPLGNTVGCMTRADLVHITPNLMHGYELKGDGDTLKRVPLQLSCYGAVFDRVTFVVTSKHFARILLPKYGLPHWVGLAIACADEINFVLPAKPVPTLNRKQLGVLLWREELASFLKSHGVKVTARTYVHECRDLLSSENIQLDDLRAYVRERLTIRMGHGVRYRDNLLKAV
jgi:hypothetical protein